MFFFQRINKKINKDTMLQFKFYLKNKNIFLMSKIIFHLGHLVTEGSKIILKDLTDKTILRPRFKINKMF